MTRRRKHAEIISEFLRTWGVVMPVDQFVEMVSNIYHRYESDFYDASQHSLQDSRKYWQAAISRVRPGLGTSLSLLDYGAGTGFATLEVLNSDIGASVKEVVCYDLSPVMMEVCKEKMKHFPSVSFVFLSGISGRDQLINERPFDLVVTNALLHHILNVDEFLRGLGRLIAPGGYYIAGHEPNHNYYANANLISTTRQFQRYKHIRQRLTLRYWLHKVGIKKSFHDLAAMTNAELIHREIIKSPLPANYLHKLVDIHVPFGLSVDQPWGEVGFCQSHIEQWLGEDFVRVGLYTYSHIKDGLASSDWFWRRRVEKLRVLYPNDGADSLMIFKRRV